MKIALLRERHEGERRIALAPKECATLIGYGVSIRMEAGAGARASLPDAAYAELGVDVVPDADAALAGAGVIVAVRWPQLIGSGTLSEALAETLESGWPEEALFVSLFGFDAPPFEAIARRRGSVLALEHLPRITRAQSMDVLSSQATAAGYAASLRAATHLPRFLPMLTTASGTVAPARILVLGAGVAGLQAIATARRLGAAVTGYDIRPAALEQIRSLGAKSLEMPAAGEETEGEGGYGKALPEEAQERQQTFLARAAADFDAIITTAQIPGRVAPLLLTREAVEAMRPGSIIVDLAGDSGGNCALSEAGRTVEVGGVTVDAPLNLASEVALNASEMFGRNLTALLRHLGAADAEIRLDPDDEITGSLLKVHRGEKRDAPWES